MALHKLFPRSMPLQVCLLAVLAFPSLTLRAEDGAQRGLACQACHNTADPAARFPHLVGQRKAYLVSQLKAFRSNERKSDLMNAVAAHLSDADIDALSAYWSSQGTGSDAVVPAAVRAIRLSHMTFPLDFPVGFVRYHRTFKSEDSTVRWFYANEATVNSARAGVAAPRGSTIIMVVYKVKLDGQNKPLQDASGNYVTGDLVSYLGMSAGTGWGATIPPLLRNDNWNYDEFNADKSLKNDFNQAICLACHTPASAEHFVFTRDQLRQSDPRP